MGRWKMYRSLHSPHAEATGGDGGISVLACANSAHRSVTMCSFNSFLLGCISIKRVRNKMPADIPPDAKIKMANDLRKAIRELRDRGLMVAAKWYVFAP